MHDHLLQGHREQFRSGKAGQQGGVAATLLCMRRRLHLLSVMVVTVFTVQL